MNRVDDLTIHICVSVIEVLDKLKVTVYEGDVSIVRGNTDVCVVWVLLPRIEILKCNVETSAYIDCLVLQVASF